MASETEKYERLARAVSELKLLSLVIVTERYDPEARQDTVGRCRYTVEFCASGRALELTRDLVAKALTENLGRIKDSLRHWSRQWLDVQREKALKETSVVLERLQSEKGEANEATL